MSNNKYHYKKGTYQYIRVSFKNNDFSHLLTLIRAY